MKSWHRSNSLFEAITFAFRGVRRAFARELNVRIQIVIGTLVVCTAIFLRFSGIQMAILVVAITIVMTLEMMNTSFELLSDIVRPEYSEHVRNAKDIAAGAVLLASVSACIVGILVFAL